MKPASFALLLSLLTCQLLWASDPSKAQPMAYESYPMQTLAVGIGKDDQLQYYALEASGGYGKINAEKVYAITKDLAAKARDIACGLSVKPETISMSAGVISMTWNTDKLCKSK